VVWRYVRQLITEPGYFRAEVERAVDADAKKNAVGADAARTLRADLERLALEGTMPIYTAATRAWASCWTPSATSSKTPSSSWSGTTVTPSESTAASGTAR
jgi:hypothetical protein